MPAFAGMTPGRFRAPPSHRHPREGGDPETSEPCLGKALDARLRGHDGRLLARRLPPVVIPAKAGIQRLQSPVAVKPWMPAFAGMTASGFRGVASSRHPREGGDPETSELCLGKALDARLRGHDDKAGCAACLPRRQAKHRDAPLRGSEGRNRTETTRCSDDPAQRPICLRISIASNTAIAGAAGWSLGMSWELSAIVTRLA